MAVVPDVSELVVLPSTNIGPSKENISMTTNKYHDFECCEWTRGVDTLLSRYKQDRDEITSLVLSDPNKLIQIIWKPNGPLAIDNECQCKMGIGETRSPFSCAQCSNLRRLMDFRMGGIDRPFQLQCGKDAGKNLIVLSTEITSPFLNWDNDSARRAKIYVQKYHNLTICGTPNLTNLRCITGDSFTIRTLILWMIHKIFSEKNLPHIPLLQTAFVCRGTGYSLFDMPSIGTISELHKIDTYHDITKNTTSKYSPLKNNIVRTIIVQLLVILIELSNYHFCHGTPSIHGLIFNKEAISYYYDNVHVEGPITLQISDLWNASATFNDVHYFPKNIKSSIYLEKGMFVPEIATKTVSMAYCHDIGISNVNSATSVPQITCPATVTTCPDESTYAMCKTQNVTLFRLTNSTLDIYNAMRHIGFPLYVGSFDFYCFMVSLMCDKSFFDTVTNDHKLYRLWSMMWLADDLHNIERMIKETHDSESQGEKSKNNRTAGNTVINIIRGAWLRCDILKFMWSLIKLGW